VCGLGKKPRDGIGHYSPADQAPSSVRSS
jgi:hypothetical protein